MKTFKSYILFRLKRCAKILVLLSGFGLLTPVAMAAESAGVLARVGETEINAEEIQASLKGLNPAQQSALSNDPVLLNQLVRTLLVQRLVLKEAKEKKWDQQADIKRLMQQALDGVITESYLQSVAASDKGYPNEQELKAAYEVNKAALVVPRQYQVAQIFIADSKGKNPEAEKAKLETIRKELKQADSDFASIAAAYSEEKQSAARGGEIGWLGESQVQADIRPILAGLAKGGVSEPVRLEDGWHIIKCIDIKESYTAPLEEVRKQLVEQMRGERARVNREAYLAKLLKDNPVSVNEIALSNIVKKPAGN